MMTKNEVCDFLKIFRSYLFATLTYVLKDNLCSCSFLYFNPIPSNHSNKILFKSVNKLITDLSFKWYILWGLCRNFTFFFKRKNKLLNLLKCSFELFAKYAYFRIKYLMTRMTMNLFLIKTFKGL